MQPHQIKQVIAYGLTFASLCACQHTLTGIGMDMEHTGKQISAYSQKKR
ncbi:MAG: hypothetical protein VXY77_02660 [Pseudomonadota bacterium]|nr:hypothetical protein [Pseudomonadota bacterium]